MIKLYFGLPGSGKTTMLAYLAKKNRKKYKNIYANVPLAMKGITYIDNDCIGKYDLSNSLLLIDEAVIFADSRRYKEFDKGKLSFFMMHRHYKCDIILFSQQWDGVDRKIRCITDRVYYIYKTRILGKFFTYSYRIPYDIIIPPRDGDGEKLGEIVQGYIEPPWYVKLFKKRIFRPFYYKYFDSFICEPLPKLPDKYKKYS